MPSPEDDYLTLLLQLDKKLQFKTDKDSRKGVEEVTRVLGNRIQQELSEFAPSIYEHLEQYIQGRLPKYTLSTVIANQFISVLNTWAINNRNDPNTLTVFKETYNRFPTFDNGHGPFGNIDEWSDDALNKEIIRLQAALNFQGPDEVPIVKQDEIDLGGHGSQQIGEGGFGQVRKLKYSGDNPDILSLADNDGYILIKTLHEGANYKELLPEGIFISDLSSGHFTTNKQQRDWFDQQNNLNIGRLIVVDDKPVIILNPVYYKHQQSKDLEKLLSIDDTNQQRKELEPDMDIFFGQLLSQMKDIIDNLHTHDKTHNDFALRNILAHAQNSENNDTFIEQLKLVGIDFGFAQSDDITKRETNTVPIQSTDKVALDGHFTFTNDEFALRFAVLEMLITYSGINHSSITKEVLRQTNLKTDSDKPIMQLVKARLSGNVTDKEVLENYVNATREVLKKSSVSPTIKNNVEKFLDTFEQPITNISSYSVKEIENDTPANDSSLKIVVGKNDNIDRIDLKQEAKPIAKDKVAWHKQWQHSLDKYYLLLTAQKLSDHSDNPENLKQSLARLRHLRVSEELKQTPVYQTVSELSDKADLSNHNISDLQDQVATLYLSTLEQDFLQKYDPNEPLQNKGSSLNITQFQHEAEKIKPFLSKYPYPENRLPEDKTDNNQWISIIQSRQTNTMNPRTDNIQQQIIKYDEQLKLIANAVSVEALRQVDAYLTDPANEKPTEKQLNAHSQINNILTIRQRLINELPASERSKQSPQLNGLKPHLVLEAIDGLKLHTLMQAVRTIKNDYKGFQFSRLKNKNDAKKLSISIDKVYHDKLLSNEQKFDKITNILNTAFTKEVSRHQKSLMHKIVHGTFKPSENNFIACVNKHSTSFHYARLLGAALRISADNMKDNQAIHSSVHKILPPKRNKADHSLQTNQFKQQLSALKKEDKAPEKSSTTDNTRRPPH